MTRAAARGEAGLHDLLVITLDDATGEIDAAFPVDEEGTASTFQALLAVFGRHGLPCSLYPDRGLRRGGRPLPPRGLSCRPQRPLCGRRRAAGLGLRRGRSDDPRRYPVHPGGTSSRQRQHGELQPPAPADSAEPDPPALWARQGAGSPLSGWRLRRLSRPPLPGPLRRRWQPARANPWTASLASAVLACG